MPRKAKVVEPAENAVAPDNGEGDAPAKNKTPKAKAPKAAKADAPVPAIAKPAKVKKAAALAAAPAKKRKPKSAAVAAEEASGEPREKRPPNAYFLFKDEVQDAVKAENPGVKTTELQKLIGERYRALSDHEKGRFLKHAAELSAAHKAKQAAAKA